MFDRDARSSVCLGSRIHSIGYRTSYSLGLSRHQQHPVRLNRVHKMQLSARHHLQRTCSPATIGRIHPSSPSVRLLLLLFYSSRPSITPYPVFRSVRWPERRGVSQQIGNSLPSSLIMHVWDPSKDSRINHSFAVTYCQFRREQLHDPTASAIHASSTRTSLLGDSINSIPWYY